MPILTIFTLTNFTLVFISCVMTILILRLYYTPSTFNSNYREVRRLPYIIRLVVFKYLAYLVCSNFHYNEENDRNDIEMIDTNIQTKKLNNKIEYYTINEKRKRFERKNKIEMDLISLKNLSTTKMKTTTIRRRSNLGKTNNEALALNVLSTLKSLKKLIY